MVLGHLVGRLAAALVGVFALVGCAAEPTPPKETPVNEDSIPSHSADTSSHDDEDGTAIPVTPVAADDDNDTAVPVTPASAKTGTPGTPAAPGTPGTDAPKDTAKTQTCTSTNGDYKSLATVSYTVTAGTATITKMTVNVTNKDSRDKNDVDVYTTPSGGSEAMDFNSGDILAHSQTVEVPQAKAMTVKSGAKVRISTNFDRALTDPSASCTIQF